MSPVGLCVVCSGLCVVLCSGLCAMCSGLCVMFWIRWFVVLWVTCSVPDYVLFAVLAYARLYLCSCTVFIYVYIYICIYIYINI